MNDRLIKYALILGIFGEDSPQAEQFANDNACCAEVWAKMTEVLLEYRQMKGTLTS